MITFTHRFLRLALLRLALILMLALGDSAWADSQQIEFRAGWNLFSLAVTPADPRVDVVLKALIDSGRLVAFWTYEANTKSWSTYDPPVGVPAIDRLQPGKAYWIHVTSASSLNVEGTIPSVETALVAGWNLLGIASEESKPYDRVFFGHPVKEIWTYDAAANKFRGVELPTSVGPPLREDFTSLQPGKGYWVYATEPAGLAPALGTTMAGDLDVPPLLDDVLTPGARLPWLDFTPGDVDIGMDGYYDRPDTQRALKFRDRTVSQTITVDNIGSGVLNWSAQIDQPEAASWLRFRVSDVETGQDLLLEQLSGSLTTDTAVLSLVADRRGMPAGDHTATITIRSEPGGAEMTRRLNVHMQVPQIDGDYKVRVTIDSVNGKKADLYNPSLLLSLYNDRDGLKGVIDNTRTLLIPERLRLTGRYYQTGVNRFALSGSLYLPEDHQDNPYGMPLIRDITLSGERVADGNSSLGPLALQGEYRETIRNVLPEPIYLTGSFEAIRVYGQPRSMDSATQEGGGGLIHDKDTLEESLEVDERILITDVDVTIDLDHSRPADLIVTLISPTGTEVRLRDRSTARTGRVTYDTEAYPVDSLADFASELSNGTWTLRIQDEETGEVGTLEGWSLDIKGTVLHKVSGTVAGVGEGATVILTGCGISLTTTTDAAGAYHFDDLIDCTYNVTALVTGYESPVQEIRVSGADVPGIELSPQQVFRDSADFVLSPKGGLGPLTVTFQDVSPPSLFSSTGSYRYLWTIYKWTDGVPGLVVAWSSDERRLVHTLEQPGIYTARMQIFDQTSAEIANVDKVQSYITVGPTGDDLQKFAVQTTAGGGGWYDPYATGWRPEQESAFDCATFDIDRPPYGDGLGVEDTDAFTGEPDPLTRTNRFVGHIGNGSLDPPAGPGGDLSYHVRMTVNVGQPIIGMSVSGEQVLHLGVVP